MAPRNDVRDRLYQLLPAVYRERDAAEGFPLQALLGLVTGQADLVREDVARLWDNFFVETCQRWAVPYVGDLVANDLLHDAQRLPGPDTAHDLFPDLAGTDLRPPIALRNRADVAKTIYYRRRKGTLPMLEELARDVTGWAAHAVEFFELLAWAQYVRNHLRLHSPGTADLRRIEAVDRVNGPFDALRHTADVRAINALDGWFNIRNVGFFLWRLRSYPLALVHARQAGPDWRYHFSPLGNRAPLFSAWRREGDEAGLAGEIHVPAPIRRAFFFDDLERYHAMDPVRPDATDLYGLFAPPAGSGLVPADGRSLFVVRNGVPIMPTADPTAPPPLFVAQVICARLDPWPAAPPVGRVIAVDVAAGRLAMGDGWGDPTTAVDVYYHYGFGADLGGGPYERARWMPSAEVLQQAPPPLRLDVREGGPLPAFQPSLQDALDEWVLQGRPNAVITVLDNRSYDLDPTLELATGRWLIVQADNGVRPHVRATGPARDLRLVGTHPGSQLTLSGLLFEGGLVVEGELGRLRLLHSTLVPGRALNEDGTAASADPSIVAAAAAGPAVVNADLRVQLAFSITGPLRLPPHASGLWLLDSIVDGLGGAVVAATGTPDGMGPPTQIERTTLLGTSFFTRLHASESIFTGAVQVEQRHEGCVRFSFVSPGSRTARRYRCQPQTEAEAQVQAAEARAQASGGTLSAAERAAIRAEVGAWLRPQFTSALYGQPAYAQLHLACPAQIREGAEDGSEMGGFCHLKQPQRETNLRLRLDEYLPFGLEAGFIYVT